MVSNKTFVAAMSGGVDSSVAASLFLEQGHNVVGATLKMKTCDDSRETTKACCGLDDNIQVRLVAEKLGIKHYFVDTREKFKDKILKYAFNQYISGKTPNPCVLCNLYLKFGALIDFAKEIGAEGIITGHYAIINREIPNKARLFTGIDDKKNQAYFLCMLTQEQLNYSHMPLGELTKIEVRQIADRLNLPNAKKSESQDACFGYKGESFSTTLSNLFNYEGKRGNIVDETGKIISEHNGIHKFTIGQRKGLGIAIGQPAFVSNINKEKNEITVSTKETSLLSIKFRAKNMNWLDFDPSKTDYLVQTRYRQEPQSAKVTRNTDDSAIVELEKPMRAVTKGQALSIFYGKQLVAGGTIDEVEN